LTQEPRKMVGFDGGHSAGRESHSREREDYRLDEQELENHRAAGQVSGETCPAVVVRTGTGLYLARTQTGIWACKTRGKLRKRLEQEGDAVYIGERVLLDRFEARAAVVAGVEVCGTAVIDSLLPRRTTLVRLAPPPWPGAALLKQVLAVNVDLMVIVVAAVLPPLKMGTIDRYLLLAAQAGIDGMVCINKSDQIEESSQREKVDSVRAALEQRGVPVVLASAQTGEGITELHSILVGKTSVFVGPSGVGKTSILKSMCPGLEAKTLSISSATGKGRHSTTYSSLIDIGDGYAADIPGLRAVGLWNLEDDVVRSEFEDIENIAKNCRFRDCTHRHEPGCAVLAAVAEGIVLRQRYEEYMKLMRDARASRKGEERGGKARLESKPGRKATRKTHLKDWDNEDALDDCESRP